MTSDAGSTNDNKSMCSTPYQITSRSCSRELQNSSSELLSHDIIDLKVKTPPNIVRINTFNGKSKTQKIRIPPNIPKSSVKVSQNAHNRSLGRVKKESQFTRNSELEVIYSNSKEYNSYSDSKKAFLGKKSVLKPSNIQFKEKVRPLKQQNGQGSQNYSGTEISAEITSDTK